ncbi:hypothetical protein GH5_01711 [Leishmania sp. Ghana 2012 LV757]|uniref:hypothetical protein n=1 Tax=Leishmania sp. Ghana 2012 LV757 TaxID=2803181 RepID=UPI001B45E319|nr:hypothetical protein GH5_01711 [Leishmania sp. Ghana 2012 LV757]
MFGLIIPSLCSLANCTTNANGHLPLSLSESHVNDDAALAALTEHTLLFPSSTAAAVAFLSPMSVLREETRVEVGADTADPSLADCSLDRSRHGSMASSRFSSRLSRRSSVRDEVQWLDEYLRKQRVIRYMQEERERAERSKLLREEHDFWVELCDRERVERLKYMTEQEIAELLQREADEARRESYGADQSYQRATEDVLRRRHIMENARRKDEDLAVPRLNNHVLADGARRAVQQEVSETAKPMPVADGARRAFTQSRLREEDLKEKCKQLATELEEAKAAAAQAQLHQKRAEDDLAREQEKMRKEKSVAAACKETEDRLSKELEEVRQQLTATETERRKAEAARAQAAQDAARKEKALTSLRMRNEELAAQKAAAEDERQRGSMSKEELKAWMDTLEKEQTARSNAEAEVAALREQVKALEAKLAATSAPGPREAADNVRKLKAVADDARKAQADLLKERQLREMAEAAAAEAKDALMEEQAAREKVEKEVRTALAESTLTTPQRQNAESERRKIAETEKMLEEMRKVSKRDEVEKTALRREIEKVKRDLEVEAAARSQLEQLASQVVSADDRALREEVYRLRKELQVSQEECDAARRDTVACQRNAELEIASLKAWCERLQQQHRGQQKPLQNDEECTPRTSTPTPHSRTSRYVRKPISKDAAEAQRQADEKAASDQCIFELKAHVTRLQADLEKSQGHEKRAVAEMEKALQALNASSDRSSPGSRKMLPNQRQSAAEKEQGAKEEAMMERVGALEREAAEAQRKYDDLVASYKEAEATLCEAERQVAAQRAQIEQLQKKDEDLPRTSALPRLEATHSEPIEAAAVENTHVFEERIKALERDLIREHEAREAAEKRAEELQKRGGVRGIGAEPKADHVEANIAASGAGTKGNSQKAMCGCF